MVGKVQGGGRKETGKFLGKAVCRSSLSLSLTHCLVSALTVTPLNPDWGGRNWGFHRGLGQSSWR